MNFHLMVPISKCPSRSIFFFDIKLHIVNVMIVVVFYNHALSFIFTYIYIFRSVYLVCSICKKEKVISYIHTSLPSSLAIYVSTY